MQYLLIENHPDIEAVFHTIGSAEYTYLKFLSANDLGLTNSHQAGIYIAKEAYPLFFAEPGKPDENREMDVTLHWHDVTTRSSFRWYGKKSRSEYRLTRNSRFFNGREEHYTGSLFILCLREGRYFAWALNREEDIEAVLNFLGVTPADTNSLIRFDLDERLRPGAERFLAGLAGEFPDTETIARKSRQIYESLYGSAKHAPDRMIVELIKIEYSLFRYIEKELYRPYLEKPFESVQHLLDISLQIHNRRKSRAGKSLELHLRYVFDLSGVPYSHGATSEIGKKPDFLFPSEGAYHDPEFPVERLFLLGAKTTCKDRWRQVLSEGDRTRTKYLFTLQQGISSAQLLEMRSAGVIPVIPAEYHQFCRREDRGELLTLAGFIDRVLTANGRQEMLFG